MTRMRRFSGISLYASTASDGVEWRITDQADATNNARYCTFKATATSASGTPETIGGTESGVSGASTAVYEVLGSTSEDGSAPASASGAKACGSGMTATKF